MTRRERKTIYGYCPYLDADYHIQADYVIYQALGMPAPEAACAGIWCDLQEECGIRECPL